MIIFGCLDISPTSDLNVDDVKIVWHPTDAREPEIMSREEWSQYITPKSSPPSNAAPWRPHFQSREDFELANIFRKYRMKAEDQDRVIKLTKAGADGKSNITFNGVRDIENAWELAKLDLVNVRYQYQFSFYCCWLVTHHN